MDAAKYISWVKTSKKRNLTIALQNTQKLASKDLLFYTTFYTTFTQNIHKTFFRNIQKNI